MPLRLLGVLVLSACALQARQAVGIVLSAESAQLRQASDGILLAAQSGDLLFPGDSLITADAGRVTFAFCPTSVRYSLAASASAQIGERKIQGQSRQLRPEPVCTLPDVASGSDIRIQAAAQFLALASAGGLTPSDVTLDPSRATALARQLADIDAALQSDPANLLLPVSKAALLAASGQFARAQAAYRSLAAPAGAPAWSGAQVVDMAARGTNPNRPPQTGAPGQTYALLVGVSEYPELDKGVWLHYADADAKLFCRYLQSPRGGSVPAANIQVLTNAAATRAVVQSELASLVAQAGENDTVILFIAAHGIILNRAPQSGAYILTSESSFEKPEDSLPMSLIQQLLENPRAAPRSTARPPKRIGQMLVFIDVCHAGAIGLLPSAAHSLNQHTAETLDNIANQASVFGLMASEAGQNSLEDQRFGEGHGAFTWYLIEGLNGAAPSDGKAISREGLLDYVFNAVCEATGQRQTPALRGNTELARIIVPNLEADGIALSPVGDIRSPRRCPAKLPEAHLAPAQPVPATAGAAPPPQIEERGIASQRIDFEQALSQLAAGARNLPAAKAALDALAPQLAPGQLDRERNRLRVALESSGQLVIQKYIAGEESPPTPVDFANCAADFDASLALAPYNPQVAGRADFCHGRDLLFKKQYPQALLRLERAVREDPLQTYSYNALGIAYLELARFEMAVPALRTAIRLSPFWAYPRHNLALALREQGKLDEAVREYTDARRRAPSRSYLPYNQGLLYYQTNQPDLAEQAYRDAIALSRESTAKPFIGRGVLYAQRGAATLAEADYRKALSLAAIPEDRLAARYNLAVLLNLTPVRSVEALSLWRQNLAENPNHIPTLTALGDSLATAGDPQAAIPLYTAIVHLAPGNTAAALKLGHLLLSAHRPAEAAVQLREALTHHAATADIYEALGDAERAAAHLPEARAAYQAGSAIALTRSQRNHLLTQSRRQQ